MNERQKPGSGKAALNDRKWISSAEKLATALDHGRSVRLADADVRFLRKLSCPPRKRTVTKATRFRSHNGLIVIS